MATSKDGFDALKKEIEKKKVVDWEGKPPVTFTESLCIDKPLTLKNLTAYLDKNICL